MKVFEEFAPKDSAVAGSLKSLLDDISVNSHVTIIALTEKPELLDDILLRSGRFTARIGIPAMSEDDIFAVVKKWNYRWNYLINLNNN